ncbi:MAG: glycerophosphoryl diester phosphodiesterase membrane domain-containing protein [Balneola sp.]|jgi:membrane-anchored glycerophosphoryl diester phosphodiesterase (GDPDase)
MQTLKLDKPRDIGQIISDTFAYIRVHHKTLLKPFVVYVLPALLLSVALLGGGFGSMFAGITQNPALAESDPSMLIGSGAALFLGFLFVILTSWLFLSVVHQHLKFAAEGEIPTHLGEFSKGMFVKGLVLVATYIGLMVPVYIAIFILAMILQDLFFIAMLALIPLFFYVMVKLMLFPAAYFIEGGSPTDAIKRSWSLTDDNFWITFGVYFVVALIFGMLSYLIIIPVMIVLVVVINVGDAAFEQNIGILMGVFYGVMYFFQLIFSSAQFISLGLHFFNLKERKDGTALRDQIDQLG